MGHPCLERLCRADVPVYCLLVNRMQFIREQSFATHHQTVNLTRALLCELVAEKILRRYNEQNPGPRGLLKLANILVAGFEPFQGAPEEIREQSTHAIHWATQKQDGKVERKLTALEVAIVSASKSFLASSACQKVVDAIYRGKLVYTPNSFIDIIPDRWKKRPISLYDPRRAPLLNQYRLIVPRTRNLIEVLQFVILLGLYIGVMAGREGRMNTEYHVVEAVFDIYCLGWVGPSRSIRIYTDRLGPRPVRLDPRTRLGRIHSEPVVLFGRHFFHHLLDLPLHAASRIPNIRCRRVHPLGSQRSGHFELWGPSVDSPVGVQRHVGKHAISLPESHDVGFSHLDRSGGLVLCRISSESEMAACRSSSGTSHFSTFRRIN